MIHDHLPINDLDHITRDLVHKLPRLVGGARGVDREHEPADLVDRQVEEDGVLPAPARRARARALLRRVQRLGDVGVRGALEDVADGGPPALSMVQCTKEHSMSLGMLTTICGRSARPRRTTEGGWISITIPGMVLLPRLVRRACV
ncbi:hypothetical protein PG985_016136 [Apiospora marii]|uniref:uncharacterized protein n=1 Tax=Apiospora marii TaxID=335849 RepID=UPI003131D5DE